MKRLLVLISIVFLFGCKYYTKEYQMGKLEKLKHPIVVTDKWQYSVMEMYVTVKDSEGEVFTTSYKLGDELYNRYMIGDTIDLTKVKDFK